MPKEHHRVRSVSYYRPSPVSTPTTAHYSTASSYASISSRPLSASLRNPYYTQQPTMSQTQYPSQVSTYSTGGPVQHPLAPVYTQPIPIVSTPPTIRPSSGAWNPTDDQTLMGARAQGMNWAPIQQMYFPTKTPNACRKRHERLMERRNADDWDGLKLETLAKNYMSMRREIWSGLASLTGEKWTVVEQKCMSQGVKNLQTAARSHARRERLVDSSSSLPHPNGLPAYEDSGIGIDDIDPDFDVGNDEGDGDGDGDSERSASGSIGSANAAFGMYQEQARQQQMQQHHQNGHNQHQNYHNQQQQHYHHGGNRLPSMDMGIDAIINRPVGR